MPSIRTLVTQGGADTFTSVAIDTNLTSDGKTGWNILGIRALWVDLAAIAAADHTLYASVQTESTVLTFADEELIDEVGWGLQNTGGVAVAVAVEPIKEHFLFEPRVTVQPTIYVAVASTSTSGTNDVIIEVFYEVVKLTDLEVLRLLAGGA